MAKSNRKNKLKRKNRESVFNSIVVILLFVQFLCVGVIVNDLRIKGQRG